MTVTREIVCGDKRFTQVGSIPGLMGGSAHKGSGRYKWPGGLVLSRCALMEQGLLPAAEQFLGAGVGRHHQEGSGLGLRHGNKKYGFDCTGHSCTWPHVCTG